MGKGAYKKNKHRGIDDKPFSKWWKRFFSKAVRREPYPPVEEEQ